MRTGLATVLVMGMATLFSIRQSAPVGVPGDVNGDGKVDACDTRMVLNIALKRPVITQIDPPARAVGTLVTLRGNNFSETPADNLVSFSGTPAQVSEVLNVGNQNVGLVVIVPSGLSLGDTKITVVVSGKTSNEADFKVASPQNGAFGRNRDVDFFDILDPIVIPDGTVNSGLGATTSVKVLDLNNDGLLDLVTAHADAGEGQNSLSSYGVVVYRGNGDGTFAALDKFNTNFPQISSGNGADFIDNFEVCLEDVNRDGILDLIYGSNNGVIVRLGDGNGRFGKNPGMDFFDIQDPIADSDGTVNSGLGATTSVKVLDLNNDGLLDLVTAHADAGEGQNSLSSYGVVVYRGNGDGTFAALDKFNTNFPQISSGNGADFIDNFEVCLEDVNRDGILDLIYGSNNGVIVRLGN